MIGKKMRDLMNEQIKNELESAYIYLSMASYFHAQNLDGMAHWMRCQAHEETIHAMKFLDHIHDRGEAVTLLNLKQLKTAWKSPLEVWQDTLEHEKFITSKIHDLVKLSRKENDISSDTLLSWFSKEQVEEEANDHEILAKLRLIGKDSSGLFMLDNELGARVFTPPPAGAGAGA